jgi:hypothetical protein
VNSANCSLPFASRLRLLGESGFDLIDHLGQRADISACPNVVAKDKPDTLFLKQ